MISVRTSWASIGCASRQRHKGATMLQDHLHKKAKRPLADAGASLETVDVSGQVPDIQNVLDEVDKALLGADKVLEQIRPVNSCTCW